MAFNRSPGWTPTGGGVAWTAAGNGEGPILAGKGWTTEGDSIDTIQAGRMKIAAMM
jgi:hypothetical protein